MLSIIPRLKVWFSRVWFCLGGGFFWAPSLTDFGDPVVVIFMECFNFFVLALLLSFHMCIFPFLCYDCVMISHRIAKVEKLQQHIFWEHQMLGISQTCCAQEEVFKCEWNPEFQINSGFLDLILKQDYSVLNILISGWPRLLKQQRNKIHEQGTHLLIEWWVARLWASPG